MKPSARRRQPFRLVRPAELRKQRCRIEDAAAHALRPVPLDEPDQPHFVHVGISGRRRVEEQDAVRSGARRKRLTVNPPAHRAGKAIDRKRRIVVPGLRFCQRLDGADHGAARALVSSRPRVLVRGLTFVAADEIEQRVELSGCRRRLAHRPERLRGRQGGPQRLSGARATPAARVRRFLVRRERGMPRERGEAVPTPEVLQFAKARIERVDARPDRHGRTGQLRKLPVRRTEQIDG